MAARVGMTDLIQRVRELAAAGTADYTAAGTTFWSDDQIQAALDRACRDVRDEALAPRGEVNSGGTTEYKTYQSQYRSFEESTGGTAVLWLRVASGARVGTALYTADYEEGSFTFAASTGGSVLYLTGRTYDVYAAAADVWRQKAGHVADRFDFSADGASYKASQLMSSYEMRARACERLASFGAQGVQTVTLYRDDVNTWPN